jgi:hypothetical protein
MKLFADISHRFGIPYWQYVLLARFENSIQDELGIKLLSLHELEGYHKGLTLGFAGQGEYELRIERGTMMLGRFWNGRREKVFEGSPAIEAEWSRLLGIVRHCEVKRKEDVHQLNRQVMMNLLRRSSAS